jgi:geranylgeranyl transferase type-2 subunit beta
MNAVYWGVTALCIMKHKDALDAEETIEYVMSCWDDEAGAFGAHPGHDAHILSTLSAIQVLVTHDALGRIDAPRVIDFILGLQQPSGIFAGDAFGETDTRFLYCAVSALSLLGALDRLDRARTVAYLAECRNFDGGFGRIAGAESHAAQVWVCTAALAILDRLDVIDVSTLGWWLAERQLPNGGLNGRPEKLEDVCYSQWVLSSLAILNKLTWIDAPALTRFILSAQVCCCYSPAASSVRTQERSTLPFRIRMAVALRIARVIWWTCSIRCLASPAFPCLVTLGWTTLTLCIACLRALSNV